MTEWQDATSYSRGDKNRIPTAYSVRLTRDFSIYVTCDHVHYRGIWILQFPPFFREYKLGAITADEAKEAALLVASLAIAELSAAVQAVRNAQTPAPGGQSRQE